MFNQENILDKFHYITYLIGSMEKTAEGDGGAKKRIEIEKELTSRGVYAINPVTLEKSKTGMSINKAKSVMSEWVEKGDWSRFKETSIKIWKGQDYLDKKGNLYHIPGDIDYVKVSNFITCIYSEGDQPCGTYGETFIALEHNIPVYLITKAPINSLKKSFLQGIYASGGMVFESMGQYLNFLENNYGLTRRDA